MNTKKKTVIISTIVIISFTIIGLIYAFFNDNETLFNKLTIGSVHIEDVDLKLQNNDNEDVNIMSPADINILSWTTRNLGTAGVLTRQTLEIYWENPDIENTKQVLYLFPANIKRETIMSDYKNGESAEYMLKTQNVSKNIEGKTMSGIKYQFVGDTLDGTSMKNISQEVNYNSSAEDVIDSSISTDDNESANDKIAYKVLMNPELSYLYQSKKLHIKITTEATQYTEDGSRNWKVVDVEEY